MAAELTFCKLFPFFVDMPNNTSPHILGTASNLLGFCLVVLTAIHFTNKPAESFVDEATAGIALLLLFSAILSFSAIRTTKSHHALRMEKWADYLFMTALAGIFLIILVVIVFYVGG